MTLLKLSAYCRRRLTSVNPSTVFCDPLRGEAHSFSDPFSELATDESLDRAADQWDVDLYCCRVVQPRSVSHPDAATEDGSVIRRLLTASAERGKTVRCG
jgi:hypothetical protein